MGVDAVGGGGHGGRLSSALNQECNLGESVLLQGACSTLTARDAGRVTFTFLDTHFHVLPMRTRFPFQYGIASMTALPHLFVRVDLVVDGRPVSGLASEGLPPKWFTKNPETAYEQDLAEMLAVIQNASRIAENAAQQPQTYFSWWQSLYEEQSSWARVREQPALLAHLGTSLMERAVLDALSKAAAMPLHQLLRRDGLGIDLGQVRPELAGVTVAETILPEPLASLEVRHTVGLADPLRRGDVPPLDDGLPHVLEDCIRAYGLRVFKVKISGNLAADRPRLREMAALFVAGCPQGFHLTLDGNEQFRQLADFRAYYDELKADASLAPLFENLLLVEQPLHRQHALEDAVATVLEAWPQAPSLILDEADADLSSLPRALDLGYSGTSHKNCKGIVKGLANKALLKARASRIRFGPILSGEDLANVGPVALLQDLSIMALLGIPHVERNGHHYFRGLSMYSEPLQRAVLQAHAGLYRQHEAGFPTLDIRAGTLDLTTVNNAPFGCGVSLETEDFITLKTWIMSGGMAAL
jgi:hypothetical protein